MDERTRNEGTGGTVRSVMTERLKTVGPHDSVVDAARIMREADCGGVPVVDGDDVVIGILTDRDIVLRMVCEGRDGNETRVNEVMSPTVFTVRPDDPLAHVHQIMSQHKVRRVPVIEGSGRLVGMVALADLANAHRGDGPLGQTLGEISEPGRTGAGRRIAR